MNKLATSPDDLSAQSGAQSRIVSANILTMILDKHANLDDILDLKRGYEAFKILDPRDQSLVKAILMTTLRNRGRIIAILKQCWNRKPPQKARVLMSNLEIAAAQILFMEIPQSAAVNIAVSVIGKDPRTKRFKSFANAILRKLTREKEQLLEKSTQQSNFPQWLKKRCNRDFGKNKTNQINTIISSEPVLDLQSKPGKGFSSISILSLPGNGGRLLEKKPIETLDDYDEGNWWVQDIAAAQPVRLLGNIKDKSVADLCAAPGGKTMQMASLGAEITAVDISARRIKRLEENLKRTNLKAEIVQSDIMDFNPEKQFDAVLLDAPCSATGTIRRHPDILWNTQPEDITQLVELQKSLIKKSAELVKPGGIFVYANCSLLKDEGEHLISNLKLDCLKLDPIKSNELPELNECINGQGIFRSLPHNLVKEEISQSGMDGFFAARFIKI